MKDLCASVCVFIFLLFFFSCMRSVWVWNDVCSIPDEDYWDKQSFKYYILKALYPSNFLHSLPPRTYMRGKRDTTASYPRNTTLSFYSQSLFLSLSFSSSFFSLTNFILRRPYFRLHLFFLQNSSQDNA